MDQHRKTIRLQSYDYSTQGAYYLTICTHERKRIFGRISSDGTLTNYPWGKAVIEIWDTLPERYPCVLDELVVMPDHVHCTLFLTGEDPHGAPKPTGSSALHHRRRSMLLSKVMGFWKSNVTKRIREDGFEGEVWQPRFWDRIVRNEAELNRIRQYIRDDPMQWAMSRGKG